MKLYCKDCDNDDDFGMAVEIDYEIDNNGNEISEIKKEVIYYCQMCKQNLTGG